MSGMRTVEEKDLKGRTIKSVDTSAVNVLHITFDNDETLDIWAEQAVWTPAGTIPGFFTDDKS